MKQLLAILIITATLFSCSKEEAVVNPVIPDFTWYFNNPNGDTAIVTPTDETYTRINWRCLGAGAKIIFDSVRVYADSSFTVNQRITYGGDNLTAIGSGNFGNGTLTFLIHLGGAGNAIFSGIKH